MDPTGRSSVLFSHATISARILARVVLGFLRLASTTGVLSSAISFCHALFESADFELMGSHKGLEIELAIFERGLGGLRRNTARRKDDRALLGEVVPTTI
ncbi:hypothetical protein HG530_002237 [Fusarium avenaceum]|nr:hypothetical protein HG530_002237 [Fusarium avenaceum]